MANRTHGQQCLGMVGLVCGVFGGSVPAIAEIAAEIPQPPLARDRSLPLQQPDALSQTSIVQVTDVQITPTESGLVIRVESQDGQLETPILTKVGNALVAHIPNARLNLPDEASIPMADPATGIALVNVTETPDNQVRIAITGKDTLPIADLVPSERGFMLEVTPGIAGIVESEDAIQITVTAQKRPEEVQDVPLSITVLSSQELEDAQIDSIEDIAQNTPNFLLFPTSPGNLPAYTIRGLGNNNFLSRDAVGFFVNGVPYDSGLFSDILLTDLERVEVLRGPQNILHGRSSIGGVVNIVTRPPADELELRSAISYGSENLVNVQLSASDALIPDTLGFRISGALNRQDGLVENTFVDRTVGDRSEAIGLAELYWTPSPDWAISLTGTVRSSDNDGFLNQTEPFVTEQDEIGFVRLNSNSQALKVTYEHENFQINSITARRFTNFDRQLDADGTSDDLIRFPLDDDTTIWSQEIRVQSPEDTDSFRWLVGGYYEWRNVESRSGFEYSELGATLLGFPSPGLDLTVFDLEQETFAVFGQIDYQPIDPLTLSVGLRYEANRSRLDRDRSFELADGGTFPTPGLNLDGEERNYGEVIPRFALEYRFSPNVAAYASATRGYRPGGLNTQTEFVEALEFEEERSWNYELGVKTNWFDNRLRANLSVFINDVDDYQVLLFDETFFSGTTANAEVEIRGLELEISATPLDGLDITAGLGLLDDEFTDFTNPLTGEDSSGNRLPFTPEFNYNLAIQYRDPGGLFGRVALQGFGTYFFSDSNQLKQDPFALVNVRLGYEGKGFGVYAFVNNLFEEEYLVSEFPGFGNTIRSFGDRRTFGLQVRARF